MSTIRVMLVDNDEGIQQALSAVIESHPELNLVGQAFTLKDALKTVEELQPDVVLVDLGLPDGSGLELIHHIRQNMQGCESMVLTVFGDEAHVISSIEAGATGYLTKDTRTADIVERLKQLCGGGSPISPVIARQLLKRFRGAVPASAPETANKVNSLSLFTPLSERELEVLQMVAKGFTQAEIADILDVSVNTISTHIKRTYKKLSVNSRTSAVHRANALGLINLKDR